jgi:hypothetical protein
MGSGAAQVGTQRNRRSAQSRRGIPIELVSAIGSGGDRIFTFTQKNRRFSEVNISDVAGCCFGGNRLG